MASFTVKRSWIISRNPRNVGEIDDADGIGEVGNAKCGDIMKMYIKVDGRHHHRREVQDLRLRLGHRDLAPWPPR